jgi:hypothetical protein
MGQWNMGLAEYLAGRKRRYNLSAPVRLPQAMGWRLASSLGTTRFQAVVLEAAEDWESAEALRSIHQRLPAVAERVLPKATVRTKIQREERSFAFEASRQCFTSEILASNAPCRNPPRPSQLGND